MIEEKDYGKSPRRAKCKSCLNCAYLKPGEHPYSNYMGEYIWYGEMADCFHNTWKRGFSAKIRELFRNSTRGTRNIDRGEHFSTSAELRSTLKEYYGLTLIPTPDDGFIELATYTCNRFYPKKKLNHRTLEACWKDQQMAKTEKDKNWTRGIAVLAIIISAISLWRTWK